MEQPILQIIGVLHGDIACREDAPSNYDESHRVGTLEIYTEYREGLDGIVAGQTIVVLFWRECSKFCVTGSISLIIADGSGS